MNKLSISNLFILIYFRSFYFYSLKIYSIIFDWKGTFYDAETQTLIDRVLELLDYLFTKNIPLYLIGKGQQEMLDETIKLNIAKYFQEIFFVEGSKKPQDFLYYIDADNPLNSLVIGDRIKSELTVGKSIGATTIWVKQGKFASEKPENERQKPDYIVNNSKQILELNIFRF